jgi:hypothetical protein
MDLNALVFRSIALSGETNGGEMSEKDFRLGYVGRIKHGDLLEALTKRGWNQKQGAEFLGIGQSEFSRWINLRDYPKNISIEMELKLFELTGKTTDSCGLR